MTAEPTARPLRRRGRISRWWILLTSVAIAGFAPLPYLTTSLAELARNDNQLAANFAARPSWFHVALYLHIVGSGLALALSPLQLSARVRSRVPRLHRVVGRITLLSIAAGGVGALLIAPYNLAGPIGTAGFGLLGLFWLVCAGAAFGSVLRRDFTAHRRWAIRTFALTYAAVTLRIWLGVVIAAQTGIGGIDEGLAFDRAYLPVPFLCWVPNLIVAERYLRRWPAPERR
jgi:uncharacterized membrane protein